MAKLNSVEYKIKKKLKKAGIEYTTRLEEYNFGIGGLYIQGFYVYINDWKYWLYDITGNIQLRETKYDGAGYVWYNIDVDNNINAIIKKIKEMQK